MEWAAWNQKLSDNQLEMLGNSASARRKKPELLGLWRCWGWRGCHCFFSLPFSPSHAFWSSFETRHWPIPQAFSVLLSSVFFLSGAHATCNFFFSSSEFHWAKRRVYTGRLHSGGEPSVFLSPVYWLGLNTMGLLPNAGPTVPGMDCCKPINCPGDVAPSTILRRCLSLLNARAIRHFFILNSLGHCFVVIDLILTIVINSGCPLESPGREFLKVLIQFRILGWGLGIECLKSTPTWF